MVRLPRFRRSPDAPAFRLTPRDLEMLRLVQRHRFLRSSHLFNLMGGSRQQLLRRLQRLFHHGYLERPRAQLDYFCRGGSQAIVYGLAKKGIGLLRVERTPEGLARVSHGSSVGRVFLEHALMVADVMVAIELGCRARGKVRFLTANDIALPPETRTLTEPFHWSVKLADRTKLGVIPDSVFVLQSGGQRIEDNGVLYFLEADRATMPVARQDLMRSSFRRKLLAYEATWTHGLHQRRFGFRRFRVITITTSTARVESLVQECQQLESGHGLFLFASIESLAAHGDALTLPFLAGHAGKVATLLD
jgi:hypothetical protein